MLSKNAKKLIVDFGNSLPITKNGSHNMTFIDQLLVAVPKRPANDIKPVSCAEDLLFLGVVLYRIENWYTNSAGVQSFPPIGVLSDEEKERLENTPLVIAEVTIYTSFRLQTQMIAKRVLKHTACEYLSLGACLLSLFSLDTCAI